MSLIVEAEYLYNDTGDHDKVYNVAVKEDIYATIHTYSVVVEWGARLGVLKQQVKHTGNSLHRAIEEFKKLVNTKKNSKGYRSVAQSASARTRLSNVPVNNSKPSIPTKPKLEKYDPNYVPERRLDIEL